MPAVDAELLHPVHCIGIDFQGFPIWLFAPQDNAAIARRGLLPRCCPSWVPRQHVLISPGRFPQPRLCITTRSSVPLDRTGRWDCRLFDRIAPSKIPEFQPPGGAHQWLRPNNICQHRSTFVISAPWELSVNPGKSRLTGPHPFRFPAIPADSPAPQQSANCAPPAAVGSYQSP